MTDTLLDVAWLNRLASYQTLFVGFSGGLDSTVLLHNLACQPELASKISAVHIHHGISRYADDWQAHCQSFCDSLSIPLIVCRVAVGTLSNIEEQARKARYAAFITLIGAQDGLLLAHHADDQAETVLLHLFRGAGVDGLAAMPAIKSLGKGALIRPYLSHSRVSLEAYASVHQLSWVDDDSNQDSLFSRNYLRHQVMPLLRARWPGVVGNLVRTASHCQQAKSNLHALAELDCDDLAGTGNRLSLTAIQAPIDRARIANVLRVWLKNNQTRLPPTETLNRLIDEVILARNDAAPCVEWDGVSVRRYQTTLYLLKNETERSSISIDWPLFPEPLQVNESCLIASPTDQGLHVPLSSKVHVGFRQGGELFYWHGQTKTLKSLLQQWHVPPWERDTVPLIYIDGELAAVVGFAISDRHFSLGSDCWILDRSLYASATH